MTQWDEAALQHLQAVVAKLRAAGVAGLLERQARAVWRRNVDTFDHMMGDTALTLGVTCAENLRELVSRACADADGPWRRGGASAVSVDRSLRLDVCGVHIGVMKAPPSRRRTPDWTGVAFNWDQESGVRRHAAEHNSTAYQPADSHQRDRQLALPVERLRTNTADAMRDLLLVWSGQMEPALTAGWLGLPSSEGLSWHAVEPLWWDEPGKDATRHTDGAPTRSADSFVDRPAAQPNVRLKSRRNDAEDERLS